MLFVQRAQLSRNGGATLKKLAEIHLALSFMGSAAIPAVVGWKMRGCPAFSSKMDFPRRHS
jgi:hypothetical protein